MSKKDYWITNSRFKYVGLLLVLMWIIFMGFLYLKADEITKDPCAICSEYMGEKVVCTTGTTYPVTKTYYPNGSIDSNINEVSEKARKDKAEEFKIDYDKLAKTIIE